MKYLFLACFLVLLAASAVTMLTAPDKTSDVPVLYWVTDPNPARVQQVEAFHQWLVDEGHVTADGRPIMELRLDTASKDPSKQIVQSVAGVASDIMDCDIGQLHALGVLADVTEDAERLGFGIDHTYAAVEPLLTRDGRQYGFPCNVGVLSLWSNPDTFEALGLEPPPREWTIEAFEAIGREFVARSNTPGERQEVFFCVSINGWMGLQFINSMHRSRGLSIFNETMTAATTDDERFAWVLQKLRQWTYDDRLMPTAADVASFSSQAGYGGAALPLFAEGRYGLMQADRWTLIRLREYDEPVPVQLSHYPTPTGGFPNSIIGTRAAAVYAGGAHQELAALFLAFLASEPYNELIVRDADALPPNPRYADSEAFFHPEGREHEWDVHGATLEAARTRGIARADCPFIAATTTDRLVEQALAKVMTSTPLATPREASATLQRQLNAEIAATVRESVRLQERYEELVELQEKIDARRAAGEPVPIEWITNPFYQRYYAAMGWLEGDGPGATGVEDGGTS